MVFDDDSGILLHIDIFLSFFEIALFESCFLLLNNLKCDDWFVDVVFFTINYVKVDADKAVIPFLSTDIPLLTLFVDVVLRSLDAFGSPDLNGKKDSTYVSGIPENSTAHCLAIIWMS